VFPRHAQTEPRDPVSPGPHHFTHIDLRHLALNGGDLRAHAYVVIDAEQFLAVVGETELTPRDEENGE